MKKEEALKGAVLDKLTFETRKYIVLASIAQGVQINPERVTVSIEENHTGQLLGQAVVTILTQHDTLCRYPRGWFQAFKLQFYPERLLRWFPVKYTHVDAEYKFPEMNPPESVLGRQFVTLKIIDEDRLRKNLAAS